MATKSPALTQELRAHIVTQVLNTTFGEREQEFEAVKAEYGQKMYRLFVSEEMEKAARMIGRVFVCFDSSVTFRHREHAGFGARMGRDVPVKHWNRGFDATDDTFLDPEDRPGRVQPTLRRVQREVEQALPGEEGNRGHAAQHAGGLQDGQGAAGSDAGSRRVPPGVGEEPAAEWDPGGRRGHREGPQDARPPVRRQAQDGVSHR